MITYSPNLGLNCSINISKKNTEIFQLRVHDDFILIYCIFRYKESGLYNIFLEATFEFEQKYLEIYQHKFEKDLIIDKNHFIKANFILYQIVDCDKSGIIKDFFIQSKILELLLLFLGEIKTKETKKEYKYIVSDSKLNYALKIIKSYPNIKIEELSKLTGLNKTYLYNGIKNKFGKNKRQISKEEKMGIAKDLILNTNLKITEIALKTGYNNKSNFSNAFKIFFGETPISVRKNKIIENHN